MHEIKSALIAILFLGATAGAARAAVIRVTNTNDSGTGSLREALATAKDSDVIDATHVAGAITLTTGVLLVERSVTINGGGANVLALDGNASSRVFQINSGNTATISGLTIRNGHDDTLGGGINIEAGATLTVTNSTVRGNSAGSVGNPEVEGGGILNSGTLIVSNSTISGNTASGISGSGGGIFNAGTLTIMDSTLSGNVAIKGAGLDNSSPTEPVMITNSAFSGNSASAYGGGCLNAGKILITQTTFSDNSASLGGCILLEGALQIGNTILNKGGSGATIDSFGEVTVTSMGYNLSSDDAGGYLTAEGDQIDTDPMLGPLQDNGGPTFTHALLPGSPAIDAGDPNFVPPPLFDQRGAGFDRVSNGRVDIGSFEAQMQTEIQLQAVGRKMGGIDTVHLSWSGATSTSVDIYRDNVLITTTANDGVYRDSTGNTGRARYTYRVCDAGTQTCSDAAKVTFRQ
jgi:hypothetical protein